MGEEFPQEQPFDEAQQPSLEQQVQPQQEGESAQPTVVKPASPEHFDVNQDDKAEVTTEDSKSDSTERVNNEKGWEMAYAQKPVQDMIANVKESTLIPEDQKQQIVEDLTVNANKLADEAAERYEKIEGAVRTQTSEAIGTILAMVDGKHSISYSSLLSMGVYGDRYRTRYGQLDEVTSRVRDNILGTFGFQKDDTATNEKVRGKNPVSVVLRSLQPGADPQKNQTLTYTYKHEGMPVVLKEEFVREQSVGYKFREGGIKTYQLWAERDLWSEQQQAKAAEDSEQ